MLGKTYDELQLGTEVTGSATLTETHVFVSAGLFNDFNPLHVNDAVARRSLFGRRIVHGPTVMGMMIGTIGNAIAGTGVANLESNFRFVAPVFLGDTVSWAWTVTRRDDKPKYEGGVVVFETACRNEDGVAVVEATNTVMVSNRRA